MTNGIANHYYLICLGIKMVLSCGGIETVQHNTSRKWEYSVYYIVNHDLVNEHIYIQGNDMDIKSVVTALILSEILIFLKSCHLACRKGNITLSFAVYTCRYK